MLIMLKYILLVFVLTNIITAEEKDHGYGNRPRGVPLNKAAFYEQKETFQCIDGSKSIPFEQVNDNYCDCPDGSDEPGTSACPNGQFYCINLGYKPKNIPSSMVNDFICDCCDGSDEYDSGVECPNICNQLGAQARKEAEEYKKVVAIGYKKREELAKEGEKIVKEKTSGVDELRKELEELQPLKTVAENKKNEAEEKEKQAKESEDKEWETKRDELKKIAAKKLFETLDVDNDSKLTTTDYMKITELDNDNNGEVSEEEAKMYMGGEEELNFETFVDKSFDSVHRMLKSKISTTTEEKKEEKKQENDNDSLDEEELEDEYSNPNINDQEEWEKRPPYSEEAQKLIEEATKMRNEFNEFLNKVSEVENKIRDAEHFVEFDFGTDHAWAPLKGQCFELNENQYTYKICLFDKTTQKDRNGHHEITLGYWGTWSADESNKYSSQKYDRGQSCWNGPERSTVVDVKCGEENKLIEVSEPNKCEYNFTFLSPAACENPDKLKEEQYHSEL